LAGTAEPGTFAGIGQEDVKASQTRLTTLQSLKTALSLMALSWSVPELQGGDLLRACQKYFQALERLVDGCEKAFGVTAQE
jgi:hypothetical protein